MFEDQQAIASYSNPNPNPLQHHTVLIPDVHPPGTDPYASSYPYSHGYDGLQARPAFEVDTTGASRSGMISQTTDSTTYEHVGGTLSETTATMVSTVMHSAGNFGVVTQHVVKDVVVTSNQNENTQIVQCEVCNLICNSEDVLEKHKQGKKHLRNVQKQAISSVIGPKMPPPVAAAAPLVGQLENKKHKLLQNGASINSLIHCDICDVVCNNQDVFQKHLAGKKHVAKATLRLANMNGIPNPTSGGITAVAQPSDGGSGKKPATIPPSAAWCELCKISCTSIEILNNHISGKKHLKKLKESEKIPNLPSTLVENPESVEAKIVKSYEGKPVSCELCGISCDTYDVLKTHLSGKKHQKNLENSKKPIGPSPAPATAIGPMPDSAGGEGKIVFTDGSKRKAKRSAVSAEDLETKKQKVLQGGGASDALRTCTLCNVVCNSSAVFISHLAGQKHAAMALKQAEGGANGEER